MRWLATVGTSGSTLLPTCIRFDSGPLPRSSPRVLPPLPRAHRRLEQHPRVVHRVRGRGRDEPAVRARRRGSEDAPREEERREVVRTDEGRFRAKRRRRRGGVQRRVRSGVERRRGRGIESEGCAERRRREEVLKDRRSPRERGRMGTSANDAVAREPARRRTRLKCAAANSADVSDTLNTGDRTRRAVAGRTYPRKKSSSSAGATRRLESARHVVASGDDAARSDRRPTGAGAASPPAPAPAPAVPFAATSASLPAIDATTPNATPARTSPRVVVRNPSAAAAPPPRRRRYRVHGIASLPPSTSRNSARSIVVVASAFADSPSNSAHPKCAAGSDDGASTRSIAASDGTVRYPHAIQMNANRARIHALVASSTSKSKSTSTSPSPSRARPPPPPPFSFARELELAADVDAVVSSSSSPEEEEEEDARWARRTSRVSAKRLGRLRRAPPRDAVFARDAGAASGRVAGRDVGGASASVDPIAGTTRGADE